MNALLAAKLTIIYTDNYASLDAQIRALDLIRYDTAETICLLMERLDLASATGALTSHEIVELRARLMAAWKQRWALVKASEMSVIKRQFAANDPFKS